MLINAHRNIGFLEGLIKHTPNKDAFAELILLKECTYSRMIGYDRSGFREVFTSREIGKGNIISNHKCGGGIQSSDKYGN